jgi:hypothetical protein
MYPGAKHGPELATRIRQALAEHRPLDEDLSLEIEVSPREWARLNGEEQ